MTRTGQEDHLVALDGLRGLAILSVLCYHLFVAETLHATGIGRFLLPMAQMGWAGVDLFFVLSGFLITGILLGARAATNYYQVFYVRRVLRIFPVYYLAVALVFWVVVPLQHHGGFFALHPAGSFGPHEQLWYWVNLSNLRTAFYPLLIPMLSPFWSLSIEEQFYIVWPAVVRNLRLRSLMVLCVSGMVLSAVLRNLPWIQHWNGIYFNLIYRLTPLHMDGLLFGGVVAMLLPRYGESRSARKLFAGLFWVSLAALVVLARNATASSMTRVGFSILPLFAGSLIWLCAAKYGSKIARLIFSARPLVRLGKYSYFIYVFHIPMFIYVPILGRHFLRGTNTASHPYLTHILLACASFAVTYAGAALSSRFFEGPILGMKRSFKFRFATQEDTDPAHADQPAVAMAQAGTANPAQ
jgi:peptidoglycan/LPS O-acetylase OafA/YrhL